MRADLRLPCRPFRTTCVLALVTLAVWSLPATAAAELVFLTTGRALSVASHRTEGASMVLALRGGGTMVLPASQVVRIAPDEVPYAVASVAASPGAVENHAAVGRAGAPFADLIAAVASARGVDTRLVHAVVEAESGYRARALSPKGAKGLMQLMPATAARYDVADPYDPRRNLEAGVAHLKDLLSRFDLREALAAYNAGEGAVRRYGGVPPFPETESYVRRILRRLSPR